MGMYRGKDFNKTKPQDENANYLIQSKFFGVDGCHGQS